MNQSTEETSVFGTEFVTIKQGTDALRDLRFKLRMMGILIFDPSYVHGDNVSTVQNTSRQESVLRKRSNSVYYHAVHELVALGEFLVGHISRKENVADSMKKVLFGQKRKYLVSKILYDIHDVH